jgi:tRNA nucleotidyltransferase/poly(A) polymerase
MKLRELLSDIDRISKRLGTAEPMICGGTVREKVMGKLSNIADLDLTTGDNTVHYLAKELAVLLGRHYSFDQKNMPDGHVSINLGNLKIDFSSNFIVPDIDNILKPQGISAPTPIQREMYSRDFTCNALLMKLDLKTVIDPTSKGIDDIHSKVIRTCLDPSITMTTNKNRVVRAIYLAAKLDFNLDTSLTAWIKSNPESIREYSSPHSLKEKLNKAVAYNPDKTVKLLTELDLWQHIPITEALQPYYNQEVAGAGRKNAQFDATISVGDLKRKLMELRNLLKDKVLSNIDPMYHGIIKPYIDIIHGWARECFKVETGKLALNNIVGIESVLTDIQKTLVPILANDIKLSMCDMDKKLSGIVSVIINDLYKLLEGS